MELNFWTFCLLFLLASFLLAFVELAIKSTPISQADYERTYGIPPGCASLQYCQGEWRHKPTGRLATKKEVEGAGLIWPTTPPGSKAGKRTTGFYGEKDAGAVSAAGTGSSSKED